MGKRKRAAQELAVPSRSEKIQRQNAQTTSRTSSPLPISTNTFVDAPQGDELKREVRLYDLLASEDDVERLDAATSIVSGLVGGQGVQSITLQRHLERRLFRGLASGRKGARLGYSVVLTELLSQLFGEADMAAVRYPALTFEKALDCLVTKTKPEGDLSGQEQKDHFLGLLFGLQSFVRAKILFSDIKRWDDIFDKLLELSYKKPWIREECGWVMVEAVEQMTQAQAEYTLQKLQGSGFATSPEGVGIWLTATKRFPHMECPEKPWGQKGNPLAHLKSLAKVLKESSVGQEDSRTEASSKVNDTGNWNPKLHFVWHLVLAQYSDAARDGIDGIESDFENFWKVSVDESLFSATASRERKYWGFLVFQKVLQDSELFGIRLPTIFSQNLMRCLINHAQEPDRFLHRSADKSLKVLVQTVELTPVLLPVILPCLIDKNGIFDFDRMTRTKTIERLLALVDSSNSASIIEILVASALSASGNETSAVRESELKRLALGDYLLSIVKQCGYMKQDKDTVVTYSLSAIAKIGYSKVDGLRVPISEKSRTLFRNRLTSAFAHLLTDLGAYRYPCNVLKCLCADAVAMDAGISKSRDLALSTIDEIQQRMRKVSNDQKPPLQALALLYSLVSFQLYNGESESVSVLDDLRICYDKLNGHGDSEASDIAPSEILVELLLSFISRPSALLRKVTQLAFTAFMADMTAGGLTLMTDVLKSSESLRGQRTLFDQDPEDVEEIGMSEDDNNSNEDELDSDVEVLSMGVEEGVFNGYVKQQDDDSHDSEGGNEALTESDDEEARNLDAALAEALGTQKLSENGADSDSDADMTDSEMIALDSKLVEIFKQRKTLPNKKQEQKDAKENMVNFKTRILDLLDIYVKKQAFNPLAYNLLLPLLQLMRTTNTKQLILKSHSVIVDFARAAKKSEGTLDTSEQIKLLKAVHDEASQDSSHAFAKAASTASLLIASSLFRTDQRTAKKIANVYRDSQVAWVNGEVKMQAAFFMDWVNWCQSYANS